MRRPTPRTLLCAAAGSAAVLVLCSSAVSSAATEGQHREVHLQLPAPTPDVVASSPGLTPVPIPAPEESNATSLEQLHPEERALGPYRSMGSVMGEVALDYADTYAYAYFDGATGVVGFSGEAPEDAIAKLAATGQPFEVHAHVGFTYIQHLAEVTRLSNELIGSISPGVPPSSVMVAPRPELGPGRIVISVASSDPEALHRLKGLADRLMAQWPFSLVVEQSDDPIVPR